MGGWLQPLTPDPPSSSAFSRAPEESTKAEIKPRKTLVLRAATFLPCERGPAWRFCDPALDCCLSRFLNLICNCVFNGAEQANPSDHEPVSIMNMLIGFGSPFCREVDKNGRVIHVRAPSAITSVKNPNAIILTDLRFIGSPFESLLCRSKVR